MNTKCTNCGAVCSLDALIANDDAREALAAVTQLSGSLAKTTIRYCGLFRPAKSQLSFARLATLINQLLPDMKSQRIERNGQLYEAPTEAWVYAMNDMIARRDNNKLATPLSGHGYLYDVIKDYRPRTGVMPAPIDPLTAQASKPMGKAQARAAHLQSRKR